MNEEEIIEKIKNNPVALAVHQVTKVMKADRPARFNKTYKTDDDIKALRSRLYSKLKNLEPLSIIDAYDNIVNEDSNFLAEPIEIIKEAKKIDLRRKEEKARYSDLEQKKLTDKTKKILQCNSSDLLIKAREKVEKRGKIGGKESIKYKKLAELELNKLTAMVPQNYADNFHKCNYHECSRAGTISRSTNGSENWYCNAHIIL